VRQLELARKIRQEQTDAENLLWSNLCAYRLSGLKFRRQQPVGSYVVDFFCPEKNLIGGQHQERVGYDEARAAWLKLKGYTVLRYWNNEVMGNLEGVPDDLGRVAGVFAEAPPSVRPLSRLGRGA
jgi:very-short-patch-repair endonuclease